MVFPTVDQIDSCWLSPSLCVLVGGEECPEIIIGGIFLDVEEDVLANNSWDAVYDCFHLEGV